MPHLEATINEQAFPITPEKLVDLDLVPTGPRRYHFIHAGVGYQVEVVSIDRAEKSILLRINGRERQVTIADEVDLLVRKLGLATVESKGGGDVYAPMPGLVLDILVEAGQRVEAGAPLIILEAMKMENVLKAEAAGEVKAIAVTKKQAVEKKQLLVEFSPL